MYEMEHSGIKGMKWGVRRYQNPDGSLTDEGRRRYGYGKEASRLMTKNTASVLKKGIKIGAGVQGGIAGLSAGGAVAALALAGTGLPAAVATSYVAGAAVSGIINGAINGAAIGGIAGAVSTRKGRKYIERYDKGLNDFERREGVR